MLQIHSRAAPNLRSTWWRTQIFVCLAPVNFWVLPCLLYIKLHKLSKTVCFCVQHCLLWLMRTGRLVKTWPKRRELVARHSVFSCAVWTLSSWARSSGHQQKKGLLSHPDPGVCWGKWVMLLIERCLSCCLGLAKKSVFLIVVDQSPFRGCLVGVPEIKHWGWGRIIQIHRLGFLL